MAVAGNEEVIKIFDLKRKISCGELCGDVHQSTITALALSKNATHVLSGDEQGTIGIWRVKDQAPLHRLVVKNTSRVASISMHTSGRMLLALYANGVLRLWNMLDARCLFKKKVGLSDQSSDSEADQDGDQDDEESVEEEKEDKAESKKLKTQAARLVSKQFDQINMRALQVIWEPTQGNLYAVLFSRILEVYSVDEDDARYSISFDTNQTSVTFLNGQQLVVSDDKGRLSVFNGIDKKTGV